jgi:acetylornithine aminotransferase/acetylornithine/N-succinyldiaminopimelate aminotransferase
MEMEDVKILYESYLFANYGREDICFDHGEKEFLYDLEGKKYIDYVAGIAVNCLGHGHPALVSAIQEQTARLIHTSNLYYMQEQAELAEELISIMPPSLEVCMFMNSGAEANEGALKLAAKYTGRTKFLACNNSFHGRTAGSLSATGQKKYQAGYECLLSNAFNFVDFNDVEALKKSITKETAGFIVETVQGEGGVLPASKEFMRTARDMCTDTGALLIVDEVQTGIGRTGRWFGFNHHEKVVPDIVSMAKALGGGVPIGAIASTREISKTFGPGAHGTTFGGNPLACAAGKAVLTTIKKDRLVEKSASQGAAWKQHLSKLIGTGPVTAVRGQGLMIGIEMGEAAKDFQKQCLAHGLLTNVAGGKVLRLVPPLILSDASMHAFNAELDAYLAGKGVKK